jgi:hypothetical protein
LPAVHSAREAARRAHWTHAPLKIVFFLRCYRNPLADAVKADRAMGMLLRAVAGGFRNLAHMQADTDLDPLRGRDDFRKLVAEVGAKAGPKAK